MVTLNQNQTLEIFTKYNLLLQHENKYKFNSKTEIQCLTCHKKIYISYFQSTVRNIFCDNHTNKANETNIVQQQYLRIIKENQLKVLNIEI